MRYDLIGASKKEKDKANKGYDLMKYVKRDETKDAAPVVRHNPAITKTLDLIRSEPVRAANLSPGPRIGLKPSINATQSPKINDAILAQRNPSVLERLGNALSDIKKGVLPGVAKSPIGEIVNSFVDRGWRKSYEKAQAKGQLPYGIPKSENAYKSFVPLNKAQSVGEFIGRNIADAPLWMAGDAALAKPLSLLAKTRPMAKAASVIPKAITPALGTGVRAGGTYGGFVAPVEALTAGDGLQGLIEREKQVPLMAAGGVALHGAGQLIGKGAKAGFNAAREGLESTKYAKYNKRNKLLKLDPLEEVQNAYKPLSLRGAKAYEYDRIFSEEPMATVQRANIRRPLANQGMTDAELLAQRQLDAQQAFGGPLSKYKIKEITTPQQRAHNARQAELEEAFGNTPTSSVDAPLTYRTLRESIDTSLGIGKPRERITQADVENKFGRPLKNYRISTDTQDAIAEVSAQMDNQLNGMEQMIRQADRQTKEATIRNEIFKRGGIRKSNDGIFEEKRVIPNWIRNDKTGMPLDQMADELGMASNELLEEISKSAYKPKNYRAEAELMAGKDPEYQALEKLLENLKAELPQRQTLPRDLTKADIKLKPRELTPKSEPIQPQRLGLSGALPVDKPIQPRLRPNVTLKPRTLKGPQPIETIPTERILPEKPTERMTWTNRDNIAFGDNRAPIRSITEQNLGELPKSPKQIAQEEKGFWQGVTKELSSKGRQHPISHELLRKEIKEGKIDISQLSNEAEVRKMLGMDLAKFSQNIKPPKQGAISEVEATWKETGKLPEPQSKIIIGKKKDKLGFKETLNKFYTATVNTQQPIVNAAKVADSDMGKLASNTKNVSGIVDYNFLKGMVDKNGNKVGESLKTTIEAIPKGREKDFWTYMSQRHNIDRAREGKPVQANYTPEMSAEAVKQIEQANPEYKAIGDGIVKWLDDFMQTWGVDTGIVNKERYGNLRKTYKNYFPTQRDFSELEKAIPDNVSQKFADQRTPIRKATGSERDIVDPVENIMNLVNRTIRTAKYNEVGQSLLNSVRQAPIKMKPLAEVIKTKDGMFSNKDNVITVLEDGKPVYLQINDKMFLDAMNGLPKAIGEIPALSTLTNTFKQLVTQSNPLFAIRNMARDIPTAYVYGSESNPFKFLWQLGGAGKDIVTNSPRLQRYQAVGGGGANFFSSGDVTKSAAEIMGKGGKIKKYATAPIKAIQKFNNLTETAPRLSEFNRVFDKTGDVTKALAAANDVTVNFSRSGNVTKSIDRVVPYMNAGVQGLDKFFRGFINPKTAIRTIVKSGVAITTPTLALHLINKDNPNYQALDNRTKDNYYLIPKEDGTFTKLPKSRELGVLFSSLLERGLRLANGQKESFKGFGNTVKTNFSPANPFDSNFFAPATWNLATNKDFAKRAIVPQSMVMDKRPDYLQFDERTTSIAKAIGEITKGMPGNEDGISPKRLDYLIRSYSGILGQLGVPLATPGASVGKTLSTQFKADPAFSNQTMTDFYDKLDRLSSTATEKNITEKIPSKKLTPEEDIKNSMNAVSSAITRGTKKINALQASNDPSKETKIKEIKTKQLELMRKGVLADTPKLMQRLENESKKLWAK